MALKTVNITGKLYNPDGTPAANATGTAVLTKLEIDNGTVVPSVVSFTTDETGLLDINLWPNERGQAGSRYRLRAKTAKNGIVDTMITVPDSDVPIGLDDVINAVPYPPVEYSKQILEQAQAAADEARDAQADIHTNWQGKLDTAAQQAETATTQAGIAIVKAAEASGSAATANAAKTAAELARDAAMVGAVTYPDEATGRAAVADGEQFQVVEGDEIVRYRRDTASTQTEVARYPTSSLVNSIASQTYGADRFTLNGFIHPSGAFSASDSYRSTDFLQVEENVLYSVRATNPGNASCAWYDVERNFISAFKGSGVSTPLDVVSPEGSAFLRMSTSVSSASDAGVVSKGGRYNLEKLASALRNFEIVIPATNVTYSEGNVSDALGRVDEKLNDPMLGVITIETDEERNSVSPHGSNERAWPPGLKVYDEGLRSEVIADGITWRLPDGTPANDAERTDVYPGFDEVRNNLGSYATASSLIADVTDSDSWSVPGSRVIERDDSKGFPALRLEFPAGGTVGVTYQAGSPVEIHRYLLFNLLVQDSSAFGVFRCELLDSSGQVLYRKNISANDMGAYPRPFEQHNDLRRFEVDVQTMAVITPGAELSQVSGFGLNFVRTAERTPVVWLGSVQSASFRPCITLRFDDAHDSVYTTAFPEMQEYGFPGIIGVVTNKVGDDGTCTEEQLLEMQAAGWDLVSHSHTHRSIDTLNYEELDFEFSESKRQLKNRLGSPLAARSCYIAPQGRHPIEAARVAYKYYDAKIGGSHLNSCMPRRPEGYYNAGGSWVRMGSYTGDLASAAGLISSAQAAIDKQAWQIVMLHKIVPSGTNPQSTLIADFMEFLEWLDDHRDEIDVVSFTQMVNRMRGFL